MFRIYAGKDNKPANYSLENVPYVPKRSLSISLDGVAENHFTLVFGFPGRTTEYLHSAAVEQIMNVTDPAKISIRDKALAVIDGFMRKDEKIKLQYGAKYAGIANSWKKWQGEVIGLMSTNAVGKKKTFEEAFQKRVEVNPIWKNQYGTLLSDLELAYKEIEKYARARDFYNETMSRIEAFAVNSQIRSLRTAQTNNGEKGLADAIPGVKERLEELYKEYNPVVDKQLFIQLLKNFAENQDLQFISPYLTEKIKEFKNDFSLMADDIYDNVDLFQNGEKVLANLTKSPELVMAANEMSHANQLLTELNNHYYKTVAQTISKQKLIN